MYVIFVSQVDDKTDRQTDRQTDIHTDNESKVQIVKQWMSVTSDSACQSLRHTHLPAFSTMCESPLGNSQDTGN